MMHVGLPAPLPARCLAAAVVAADLSAQQGVSSSASVLASGQLASLRAVGVGRAGRRAVAVRGL